LVDIRNKLQIIVILCTYIMHLRGKYSLWARHLYLIALSRTLQLVFTKMCWQGLSSFYGFSLQ